MANTTAAKEQHRLLKQGYAGEALSGTGENARAKAYYAATNKGEQTEAERNIAKGYTKPAAVEEVDPGTDPVSEPGA